MVEAAAAAAVEVNVVLTGEADAADKTGARTASDRADAEHIDMADVISGGDREFFEISRSMRAQLRAAGERSGAEYREHEIPAEYAADVRPQISIVSAADFYAEAESSADRYFDAFLTGTAYRFS